MRTTALALALVGLATFAHANWQEPENLGSTINTAAGEWYPVIARDGSFMIFVSDRPGGFGQTDLWISLNIGGEWASPVNMGLNVNSAAVESAPFLAENDAVLYFASFVSGGHGGMDIYSSPLDMGIPGPKTNLGPIVNGPFLDCCPVLSPDGNSLYICSDRPGSMGSMDVWVSEKVGGDWTVPVSTGINLNSPQTDCPRWISDDGTTLILSTTRGGGQGSADLWYSQQNGGDWGPLVNMGSVINSVFEEWGPGFIDNEGAIGGTIYFGSSRTGGHGGRDIWRSAYSTTAVSEAPPAHHLMLRIFPNPCATATTISYTLAEAAPVSLRLYDPEGHLVRTLQDRRQVPGSHRVSWDGTSDAGAALPGGVYFCRLRVGTEEMTQKVVMTRE